MKNSNQKMHKRENVEYAGFWIRLLAFLVDQVIIFAFFLFILGLLVLFGVSPGVQFVLSMLTLFFLFPLGSFLYFVVMTSRCQATLGKKLLGLRVVADDKKGLSRNSVAVREKKVSAGVIAGVVVAVFLLIQLQAALFFVGIVSTSADKIDDTHTEWP